MSTRIAFLFVAAACGGKAVAPPSSTGPGPTITAHAPVVAPAVSVAGAIATDDSPPPVVVMIDEKGQRSLAAAPSWRALGEGTFSSGPKPAGDTASLDAVIRGRGEGKEAKAIVDDFKDYRTEAELHPKPVSPADDPPPPDDEGGSGTAMALEEGRMGKKDAGPRRGRLRDPAKRADDVARQATIVGEATSAKPEGLPAVVVAHPSAKAAVVVKAVSELEAMIGVRSGGEIRPLRIQFQRDLKPGEPDAPDWIEVRIDGSALAIEAVPSKAASVTWADAAARLGAAVVEARGKRGFGADTPVDVLVGPDLDAQRLIDVLATLVAANVKSIGLGLMPTGKQLQVRGRDPEPKAKPANVPTVSQGNPSAVGDLDKEIIRRYIRRNIAKIQYCYEKELVATPGIKGTITVQFFIQPDGLVKQASGAGFHPAVASCVANVIRAIEFPKPKGGGGVQVSYPFTFQPQS